MLPVVHTDHDVGAAAAVDHVVRVAEVPGLVAVAWIERLRPGPAGDRVDAVSAPERARAAGRTSVQRVVAVAAVQEVGLSDARTGGGLAEVVERVVAAVAEELRADTASRRTSSSLAPMRMSLPSPPWMTTVIVESSS